MSFVSTYNAVTIQSTATQVLSGNAERKGAIFSNNGTQTLFLGMDSSVTTSNGLPLVANGTLTMDDFGGVWKGQVWGIVASSTADLRYWEFGA